MALEYSPEGFYLAFSGGKDSQVVYHLAELAGVKFEAHMNLTSVDPPEVIRFVRTAYPGVRMHPPKQSFYSLCVKKGALPTAIMRFCCAEFKETGGAGRVCMTGVRREESARRAKRGELDFSREKKATVDYWDANKELFANCVNGREKVVFNPIIDWTEGMVWRFLDEQGVDHCPLYDEGWKRVGCVMCPMANHRAIARDMARWPHRVERIKETINRIKEVKGDKAEGVWREDADTVFEWWVSRLSFSEFLIKKEIQKKQMRLL